MPGVDEVLEKLLDGRESFFVERHYAGEVVQAPGARKPHVELHEAGYMCGVEGIPLGYGDTPGKAVHAALEVLENPKHTSTPAQAVSAFVEQLEAINGND